MLLDCRIGVLTLLQCNLAYRNHSLPCILQDLVDSYLPSFQTCVEEGKVSGIMCSYNAVNGVPSCANDWLLGTLLRDSWQVRGGVRAVGSSSLFN